MNGLIELPLQDTIDVHTAARMARVCPSTVRRWCDEGKVAACKPAGRWRVYRSEYVVWLTSGSTRTDDAPIFKPPVRLAVPPQRRPVKRSASTVTLPLFPE